MGGQNEGCDLTSLEGNATIPSHSLNGRLKDIMTDKNEILYSGDVAEILGKTTRWVVMLFQRGSIDAVQMGRMWITTKEDVKKYLKQQEGKQKQRN